MGYIIEIIGAALTLAVALVGGTAVVCHTLARDDKREDEEDEQNVQDQD